MPKKHSQSFPKPVATIHPALSPSSRGSKSPNSPRDVASLIERSRRHYHGHPGVDPLRSPFETLSSSIHHDESAPQPQTQPQVQAVTPSQRWLARRHARPPPGPAAPRSGFHDGTMNSEPLIDGVDQLGYALLAAFPDSRLEIPRPRSLTHLTMVALARSLRDIAEDYGGDLTWLPSRHKELLLAYIPWLGCELTVSDLKALFVSLDEAADLKDNGDRHVTRYHQPEIKSLRVGRAIHNAKFWQALLPVLTISVKKRDSVSDSWEDEALEMDGDQGGVLKRGRYILRFPNVTHLSLAYACGTTWELVLSILRFFPRLTHLQVDDLLPPYDQRVIKAALIPQNMLGWQKPNKSVPEMQFRPVEELCPRLKWVQFITKKRDFKQWWDRFAVTAAGKEEISKAFPKIEHIDSRIADHDWMRKVAELQHMSMPCEDLDDDAKITRYVDDFTIKQLQNIGENFTKADQPWYDFGWDLSEAVRLEIKIREQLPPAIQWKDRDEETDLDLAKNVSELSWCAPG